MLRFASFPWVLLGVSLASCAGKTEQGGGSGNSDAAPVQKPAAGPANAEAPRAEPARHLLMVVELEPAAHAARTVASRSVDLPLPRRRGPARRAPWRVDVLSPSGEVLYSAPLQDTSTVRGEFRDEKTGELQGHSLQQRVAAVTLRLPWLKDAAVVRVLDVSGGNESELGRVPYPQVAQ
ncbi:MAG TPA: hypothetical protein VHB79_26835 [Polyangiaceae bacterium]|nr:hypothetical protein [Polyangiaceae bacterium]